MLGEDEQKALGTAKKEDSGSKSIAHKHINNEHREYFYAVHQ